MRALVTGQTEFCTAIDAAYVPYWLALHRSMTRHDAETRFRVCCWDDQAKALIDALGLPGVVAMPLSELEAADPELAAVRDTRSFREYRSTAKPSLCRYALDADAAVEVVVYLDVDLMFFTAPADALAEAQGASILLVPQRHPDGKQQLDETFGRYQAATIAFRRGHAAIEALAWWRARCLEWCSHVPEPGRWADQRYLQDWPERFGGVRVVEDVGVGLAPWNAGGHRIDGDGGRVRIDGRPLVLYHYSGMSVAAGNAVLLRLLALLPGLHQSAQLLWGHPWYRVPRPERELVWDPYARELSAAFAATGVSPPSSPWRLLAEIVLRRRVLWGTMWALRIALKRARRVARGRRAEHALADALGAVDRLRRRWRVE